jgi:hypothetical protein
MTKKLLSSESWWERAINSESVKKFTSNIDKDPELETHGPPDDFINVISGISKFKMYPSKWIFVTFQREGIHCWPDAKHIPAIEFLAHPHRHMFHFRVELQVFHDDREVEFILFKRELEKQYEVGTLQLDYKSCEMMADELAVYIQQHYPGRFMKIEVSEDGENGAVSYYSGDLND